MMRLLLSKPNLFGVGVGERVAVYKLFERTNLGCVYRSFLADLYYEVFWGIALISLNPGFTFLRRSRRYSICFLFVTKTFPQLRVSQWSFRFGTTLAPNQWRQEPRVPCQRIWFPGLLACDCIVGRLELACLRTWNCEYYSCTVGCNLYCTNKYSTSLFRFLNRVKDIAFELEMPLDSPPSEVWSTLQEEVGQVASVQEAGVTKSRCI